MPVGDSRVPIGGLPTVARYRPMRPDGARNRSVSAANSAELRRRIAVETALFGRQRSLTAFPTTLT